MPCLHWCLPRLHNSFACICVAKEQSIRVFIVSVIKVRNCLPPAFAVTGVYCCPLAHPWQIGTTSATSTAAGHTLSRHWFRACTSAGQDDDERTRPRSTRPRRPRVLDQRVFAERVLAAHVHDDQSQDPICIRTVCARPIRVKTGNASVTAPSGKASSATLLPACPSFTPGRSALAPSAPKSKGGGQGWSHGRQC